MISFSAMVSRLVPTLLRAAVALPVAAFGLLAPAPATAQFTNMATDRLTAVLPSGLEISGTLHARIGLRSGPFVQMGHSDLVWDAYTHGSTRYTYQELRRMFGDRIPARAITDGNFKVQLRVSATGCAIVYQIDYLLDVQLGRVQDIEDGVFNGIANEYTYSLNGGERLDADRSQADAECIRENKPFAALTFQGLSSHYFPDRVHGGRYEAVLDKLLDEREQSRQEAESAARAEASSARPPTSDVQSGAGAGSATSSGSRAASGATASGSSTGASGNSAQLTRAQQNQYDTAIRLARQFEAAGNYPLAIRNYRSAHSITREEWITQHIEALGRRQQAEAEAERELVEQGAEAMAQGARAAGQMIDAFEAGLDDSALRVLAVEGNFGLINGAPSGGASDDEYEGYGARVDAEAELNIWFHRWGGLLYNVGGGAGWNGSLFPVSDLEPAKGFRNQQRGHNYFLKAGVGGHLEVGHGARSYAASFNSESSIISAQEGFLVFSLGNFARKGGSWRLSYLTTSELSLLGGGDGRVEEQTALFSYWSRGSVMAWKAGMTTLNYDGRDDASYNYFFLSWGLSFR